MRIKVVLILALLSGVLFLALQHIRPQRIQPSEAKPAADIAGGSVAAPSGTAQGGTASPAAQLPSSPAAPSVSSRPSTPDEAWARPVNEPVFAAFKEWITRHQNAATANTALEQEGVALARERLSAMADLIQSNPERAMALAVPPSLQSRLPAAVQAFTESWVKQTGDYEVICVTPMPGRLPFSPFVRVATIDNAVHRVFTFGRALEYVSRSAMPMNGISVPVTAATRLLFTATGHPVTRLMAMSAPLDGSDAGFDVPQTPGNLPTAESGYTEGRKRYLLMRVDFSDYANDVFPTNTALQHMVDMSNFLAAVSYNKHIIAPVGKGSDITPVMRMANLVSFYDNKGLSDLYPEARNVAQNVHGYDLSKYDFFFVCTGGAPAYGYAGLGYVGGVGYHLANGYFDVRTSAHELGHNLGLSHANWWETGDRSTLGAGSNQEYGDPYDTMGGSGGGIRHFSASFKNRLDWIPASDAITVTSSGTHRLHAHDITIAPFGLRAIRLNRSSGDPYWIEFRQLWTGNKALMNGVSFRRAAGASQLIDMNPGTSAGKDDVSLTIGRTFSDAGNNLHVTALRKGNTFPESIDLQIHLGTFPGNQSPVAVATASTLTAAAAQNITFTATASDPNGDALAYYWDFGDGDYSVDNSAITTHSFAAAGEYYVEVTVSDMKGGVARDSVIVNVGSAGTFAISGRVLNADGQPLGGIRLSVDASRYAFSESDGTYAISRLGAGNYTVSAIDPVNDAYTFANPFFNNPVAVGPDFTTADFIVSTNPPPIVTPLIAANSAWKYLDNGTDQGTAWRAPAFIDAAWATGNGVLGYTDGNDAINTTISFGPNSASKYITYYFRRTFTVANPAALTSLLLKTLRDDAAVVYLNGTEIYRDNLPAGTPLFNTLASASSEAAGYISQSLPTTGLLAGNNTLAVEVHQSAITSSDVVFDLSLDGLTAVGAAPFQMVYLSTPAFRQVLTNPPSVTLNAFARSSAAAASRVDFYVDGAKIGEDAASPFSFVWPAPTVGVHTLNVVAIFGATSVTSAPVPVTIAAPAALSVTLSAPETGTEFTLPASLPLAATVTAGAAAISYVEFYANGLPISQDNTAPFTATLLETLPGTQELLAVVADSTGNVATSAPVHVTFSRPDTGAGLISFGDVWKYLDDGSNQGNAWRARNFDDRAWLSGPGRLGYGGDGESTLVSAGTNAAQRYITTYFRKHFTVANPASYGGLLLRLRRDDGAVVYLNGTEVFRDNLPSGLVSWITLASTTVDAANETNSLDLRLSTAGLIAGTNVIAVEMHQASVSSSDVGFDLALIGLNLAPPSAPLYLTQPAEGAHFNTSANVQLASYLEPAIGALESIQYFADGSLVASGSLTPPYAATWANAPVGNHQLHVVAVRGGIASTSAPVNVAVGKAPPVSAPIASTVISLGAAWRYWDNVAAVGPGWQTRPFNDSAWPSANARFGWGFDGENTTLTSGRVTHYFRRWFNLPPAGSYSELVFQIARDDGAVVYMNGIEIFRSNMPNGPVTASTLAATTVNAPEETIFYEVSLPTIGSGLVTGTNLIAVELHQSAAASSDAGFDMQLIAYGSTAGRVYLTTPLLGSSFSGPQDIAIEALVRGSGSATVTNVEFFIDGQKLTELTASPWRVTWSNAPLGGHLITAYSHDTLGFTSVSAPLEIAIGRSSVTSTLIASNSVWRFRDTGVDQGTTWVNLNFNEAGWGTGAARLGFGGDGEVTLVNGGPNNTRFPTIYFRKKFLVTPGAVFTNLLFKLACDDGAVVHLNGQEVFRQNMLDGPLSFTTLANSATDEQTFFPTSVPITGLPAGTNILAVEVHQSSATSSDLGLNLELTAQGYEDAAVPPTLKILIDDDVVELRWPTTAVGWQVYSAVAIDAPAIGWTLTPGTLLQLSGENVFTVTPGAGNQFFRLRKQ